jgi:hypothetical protein
MTISNNTVAFFKKFFEDFISELSKEFPGVKGKIGAIKTPPPLDKLISLSIFPFEIDLLAELRKKDNLILIEIIFCTPEGNILKNTINFECREVDLPSMVLKERGHLYEAAVSLLSAPKNHDVAG